MRGGGPYVACMLVLASCGRLAFDPLGDDGATTQCTPVVDHDEDGDSIADECDVCPHIADSTQPDVDADRVGDACDPNPGMPRERIAFFDPFTSQRPEWAFPDTMPQFGNDWLSVDTRPMEMEANLDLVPAEDVYMIGGRFGAGVTGQRQLAIAMREASRQAYYYCELDDGGSANFALTYFDGSNFQSIASSPANRIENGAMSVQFRNAPPMFSCQTTWPATMPALTAAIPAGIAAVEVSIRIDGLQAELDYFIHIRSD